MFCWGLRSAVLFGDGAAEMYPLKEGIVQPLHCDGIGTEFDASAKYIYRKSSVANAGVGHLFPGYVMTNSGHGAPLTLVYLQLTYRFKIDH